MMTMRSKKRIFAAACGLLVAAWCAPLAGAQEAANNTNYRTAKRDPFTNYKVMFRRKVAKKESPKPMPITAPSIQARIEQFKAQKRAAINLQQPAPKPTTALLLGEVRVTGIFRTPRGVAAMVEATPIKLSYVIYPGETFYNGMLVAIEDSRLVFRKETRWTDGRRDVAVETKPLEQPSAADALTAQKTGEAGQPAAPGKSQPEAPARKDDAKALASKSN
ncbi:MAG TPA: hypothetical protein VF240_22435 [Pyrinomonadaceae bacterium]